MSSSQVPAHVRFWTTQTLWPHDTDEYEFLGRVLLRTARGVHGDAWDDQDPAAVLLDPLPAQLSLNTPLPEIQRAAEVLYDHHAPYRDRSHGGLFGPGKDFPSRDEWAIAKRLIQADVDRSLAARRRFIAVTGALADAFRRGEMETATRGYGGGNFTKQPWHFWNMEFPFVRFDTCRVNPADPFCWSPAEFGGHWIFVVRAGVKPSLAVSNVSDEVVQEINSQAKRRRGRKPKASWDWITAEFVKIVHIEGVPEEVNLSALGERLWKLAADNELSDIPEPKTISDKLRVWLPRFDA